VANNNAYGIIVDGISNYDYRLDVMILDSIMDSNLAWGLLALSGVVRDSIVRGSDAGLGNWEADLRLAHSVVTWNDIGVLVYSPHACLSPGN
jgi:hypothetical protein